ncbi:MAG: hypothetical protein J2O48_10160, partial [Solirubrobacterales bacterium]|nr:hypothetical protein [Solirubrobacterales bacterium]
MLAKLVSDAPPERPAIGAVCYGELYARAQAFAAGMRGIDKLGVALEPADAVAALVGANLAGVEPCLYPPELDASRLDSLAQSFGHEHVLVS